MRPVGYSRRDMPHFRLRFHLEPSYRLRSDAARLPIGDGEVFLEAAGGGVLESTDRFVLLSQDYPTEDQARIAGMRWADALLLAGLRTRRGLDLEPSPPRPASWASITCLAASRFARSVSSGRIPGR